MYFKLMVRGLLRHKKSGRRLFALLALCSLAVMFCLAFRDSFARQYRQLGIDISTAHLQILPKDSPKNQQEMWGDQREGLVLLRYDRELSALLAGMSQVEVAMPAIETGGAIFDLEGEATGYSTPVMGVDPDLLAKVLPAVAVVDGQPGLAWSGQGAEAPLFRPRPDVGESGRDSDRFVRRNFRPTGEAWEQYKSATAARFPALFAADPGKPLGEEAGVTGDEVFLAAMNRALERSDLLAAAPVPEGDYDYRIDDARAALETAEKAGSGAGLKPAQAHRQKVARKRWLQALMAADIRPVWDIVNIDTAYTLTVPPARGDDLLAQPAVIPVRMKAFVERMPLYFFNFYIDQRVLQEYLSLEPDEVTTVFVRLKDSADIPVVKARLENELRQRGLDYVVKDAETLGKMFLSTALAFDVILMIIIVLFVATVAVFLVNSVSLALIKRRREIGTSIALGLSPGQNGLLMFGEVGVLVLLSWLGGAVLGTVLELVLVQVGMPGMIFFPGERLYFLYSPVHALQSLVIVLPIALAATAWALRKTGSLRAVDLLKEAS